MPRSLHRVATVLVLLLLGGALSGCIFEEGGGYGRGWCYWHPYACH